MSMLQNRLVTPCVSRPRDALYFFLDAIFERLLFEIPCGALEQAVHVLAVVRRADLRFGILSN